MRGRLLRGGVLVMIVGLGLGSRRLGGSLPGLVAAYAGDVLYATMMVILLGFLLRRPVIPALVVCVLIEFSQAWHPAWLDAVRSTLVGRLILGQGFLWTDLVCYFAGAVLGWAVDSGLRRLAN